MTCAIGLKANGRVYIGVDSACSSHVVQVTNRNTGKLFRLGPLLIASAGSRRAPQIIQHFVEDTFSGIEKDPYRWLVRRFIPTVRRLLGEHGNLEKYPEGSEKQDISLIIGYRSRLFEICNDFQINEWRAPYCAVGSGDQTALGALFATPNLEPIARIKLALAAAAELQGSVRAPFYVEATESKRTRVRRPRLVLKETETA